MNQFYDINRYFDMIVMSSIMSTFTSQINVLISKILSLINGLIQIILIFFEKIIFRLFAGHVTKDIIIDEFNPLFSVIESHVFDNNKTSCVWWFKYFNFVGSVKAKLHAKEIRDTNLSSTNGAQSNQNENKKNILKPCKNNQCIICSNNPLLLTYPQNTYDGTINTIKYNNEHYCILKLDDRIILEIDGNKIMFERYLCDNYSKIIVTKIYSRKPITNHLDIIQTFLNTLNNYKKTMFYTSEIYDTYKNTGYGPNKIFGNLNFYEFRDLIDKMSKNSNCDNNLLPEGFIDQNTNKKSLSINCAKLSITTIEDLQICRPIVITEYKTNLKLQKKLNVGFRIYYNNSYSLEAKSSNHTVIVSMREYLISFIETYNGHGILISKIGSPVSDPEIKILMAEILSIYNKNIDNAKLLIYKLQNIQTMSWTTNKLCQRSLDSIYLPFNQKEEIKNTMNAFINNEIAYKKLGITYKLGLLFYGPPGTGKTSLVKALANDYNMSVYVMDLNNVGINDDNISNIINSLPDSDKYKILLFEDVDAAFIDKEKITQVSRATIRNEENKFDNNEMIIKSSDNDDEDKDKHSLIKNENKSKQIIEEKHLTYSGLLNAFDGVTSNQSKVIMIMTTNHKEKLGDALIRPGRIDYIFCIDYCTKNQIIEMVFKILNILTFNSALNEDEINALNEKITDFANKIINMFDDINNNSISLTGLSNNKIGVTPAKIQAYVMKYSNNLELLFNNYTELLLNSN